MYLRILLASIQDFIGFLKDFISIPSRISGGAPGGAPEHWKILVLTKHCVQRRRQNNPLNKVRKQDVLESERGKRNAIPVLGPPIWDNLDHLELRRCVRRHDGHAVRRVGARQDPRRCGAFPDKLVRSCRRLLGVLHRRSLDNKIEHCWDLKLNSLLVHSTVPGTQYTHRSRWSYPNFGWHWCRLLSYENINFTIAIRIKK